MKQPPEQSGETTPVEPGYLTQPGYPVEETGVARDVSATPSTAGSWVPLSRLKGMPLVDVGTGNRLGDLEDVLLSHDHRYVEAYTVRGGFLRKGEAFPAGNATIGADAIAVRLPPRVEVASDVQRFKTLPGAHRLLSMALLTETGQIVGRVTDVRLDPHSGAVVGYEVRPASEGLADRMRRTPPRVLPATAIQQHGADALIVTDAAARQYLEDGA